MHFGAARWWILQYGRLNSIRCVIFLNMIQPSMPRLYPKRSNCLTLYGLGEVPDRGSLKMVHLLAIVDRIAIKHKRKAKRAYSVLKFRAPKAQPIYRDNTAAVFDTDGMWSFSVSGQIPSKCN